VSWPNNVLRRQVVELQERIEEREEESVFETKSLVYRAFLQTVLRVAASDSVVLLSRRERHRKNVLAHLIRSKSKRSRRPFVSVHCPMLGGDLLTSFALRPQEGAFTGAVADVVGKVEEAAGRGPCSSTRSLT
jgi:NtrC-family two-component system response regulator AlgB